MQTAGGVFFAYCFNNPLIYTDPTGQKSWFGKFTSWIKKGWDEAWDAGNQLARWLDKQGLHSGSIGGTVNNNGNFAFKGVLNDQQLDWTGENTSINIAVAKASSSVSAPDGASVTRSYLFSKKIT